MNKICNIGEQNKELKRFTNEGGVEMNDEDIMVLISAGDINALEQLYNNTYKKVFVFILSMIKCRQTTEDLILMSMYF